MLVFAATWKRHARVVNCCIEHGSAVSATRRVVSKEVLARLGLYWFPAGASMALDLDNDLDRVPESRRCAVSIFDHSGRVSQEWVSEWASGRPLKLSDTRYFDADDAVDSRNTLVVTSYSKEPRVPGVKEFSRIPFERRDARDHRRGGAPVFDPTLGVPAAYQITSGMVWLVAVAVGLCMAAWFRLRRYKTS